MPHISSNIGKMTMNFCHNMFNCMANISNIWLVYGDSVLSEHMDNVSKSKHQYGDLSISEGDIQRHFGAVFLVYRDTPWLAHFRMIEPWYLPIKGHIVRQIWHQCNQECAKCVQYMFYIGRHSRLVVGNCKNGHLAKSQRLNKKHSRKPADLETSAMKLYHEVYRYMWNISTVRNS